MNYEELLNPEQLKAVMHTKGPLLILAGAGSGKTRVLTHRIAYLMEKCNVNPWNILALTFTNKAASEMRERVDDLVGYGAENIWVSTFHSTCVRILRRNISTLGYDTSFTIYDSADQKTLIKDICKMLNIDTKKIKEATILNKISSAKDRLLSPDDYMREAEGDYLQKTYAKIYTEYQKQLKKNNALDFDDLIFKTVELFKIDNDALSYYQNRFKYIMVDEYQDTNHAQFVLISQLASTTNEYGEVEHNLCVVGDDDQSIYRFRGADIYNILDFENQFKDTTIIKLEQNYRSTKSILDVANEVIHNNPSRKDKTLWTDNEQGDPVSFTQFSSAYEEAESVAHAIRDKNRNDGISFNDFAILYRTNAQSRIIEERLVNYNIPYKIIGGTNFYSRKEIKDVLAYLRVINNPQDDIQVKRIINIPKRGIGLTTINKLTDYSQENYISFYDAVLNAKSVPGMSRACEKLESFANLIEALRSKNASPDCSLEELFNTVMEVTGYTKELELENTPESITRLENIEEFLNKIVSFEEESTIDTNIEADSNSSLLSSFLEEVSLVADIDNYDENEEKIVLMTLHGSKGLEFPYVFLTGMEEGLFPSYRSISSGEKEDIEEERRLCYVGITRARQKLFLSAARERMINGETSYNRPSRFINEIPRYLLQQNSTNDKTKIAPVDDYLSSRGSKKSNSSNLSGKDLLLNNPFIQKGFGQKNTLSSTVFDKRVPLSSIDYTTGDTVSHKKFGIGTVTDMIKVDDDFTVTVKFENSGVKKMKASFAKLVKQ